MLGLAKIELRTAKNQFQHMMEGLADPLIETIGYEQMAIGCHGKNEESHAE